MPSFAGNNSSPIAASAPGNVHVHAPISSPPHLAADKPRSEQDHAARVANGSAPVMNGKAPSGTAASPALPNGSLAEGRGRSLRMDGDAPSNRSPEGPGSAGESPGRDDGYFASVYSSEQQQGWGTTKVHLGALTAAESRKEAQKDFVAPAKHHPSEAAGPHHPHAGSDNTLHVPNSTSTYRVSSPPTFNHASPSPSQLPIRGPQRHTLEVPRASTARSRDTQTTHNSTDDVVTATGRFSPNTPTRRRGSMSLVRRTTRSINSDMHLDEVPQDEDAARWAEHIRQKRASKRKRKEDEDEDRVLVGTKVDQNHNNWIMAYNMLTGIRFTVSRTNAKMDRELNDADFDACNKFSFDITGNELTPSAKYDFKFKDYAPWVFRHLRANFGLDPADYLVSLTSKYILSELGSPGKSGSFFYFSRDYKYIIKTIHHGEHKFLRRILRDYYNHVQDNPNTLLSQFYGLHRVKIPYGRKVHFVVMNNLFPPHRDIHRTFDLKGSTIGRDFKEDDLDKNPRATLKDLNWLRRDMHLEFGPTKKKAFVEQMGRDVELLQRLHIMDYSMLIGIHDLERGNEDNLRDKTLQVFQPGGEAAEDPVPNMLLRTPSKLENARKARELRHLLNVQKPVPMEQTGDKMPDETHDPKKKLYFYADDGGFRATHEDDAPGEEIYYLGIIDCLTEYTLFKRIEHFLKGLKHEETQISPIPPERYGDRFVKFLSSVTKTREAAEREKHDEPAPVDSEPQLNGINATHQDRASTEKVIEKAEKQAERSRQRGASEEDVPDRHMHIVRSPSAERGDLGTTLPVVEELMESSSTGGRSARSTETSLAPAPPLKEEDRHREPHSQAFGPKDSAQSHQGQKPPPTPPKDSTTGHMSMDEKRPPTPPKDMQYQNRNSGPPTPPKEVKAGQREKELPLPPAMETFVRVN